MTACCSIGLYTVYFDVFVGGGGGSEGGSRPSWRDKQQEKGKFWISSKCMKILSKVKQNSIKWSIRTVKRFNK